MGDMRCCLPWSALNLSFDYYLQVPSVPLRQACLSIVSL